MSELVELARDMCHEQGGIWAFIRQTRRDTYLRHAGAVLASPWLRAHDDRIRAEERERAPRVELVKAIGLPSSCKVWVNGRLVFAGRDET